MSGLTESLDVRLYETASNGLSHAEFLELILEDELSVRHSRAIDLRRVEIALRMGQGKSNTLARYLKPDLLRHCFQYQLVRQIPILPVRFEEKGSIPLTRLQPKSQSQPFAADHLSEYPPVAGYQSTRHPTGRQKSWIHFLEFLPESASDRIAEPVFDV